MYAESFAKFGSPLKLEKSNAWIIKRAVLGTGKFDAMGCYPIFSCLDWAGLAHDLKVIAPEIISLSLVTDPFGEYTPEYLADHFDIARPYKEHFVVNLQQDAKIFVSRHHQRNAKRALLTTKVDVCVDEPVKFLDEWSRLYKLLVERHNIQGIAEFSRDAFSKQLKTPGMVLFRATIDGKIAGMSLWYIQGKVAYYHLAAYNALGYEKKVSFGIFWKVIEYFADMNIDWLSLGAGAGLKHEENGLTRFKKGWATGTRTAFFCGKIFDAEKYEELTSNMGVRGSDYFPAYRTGDFG
jgi:hypothetical protein